MAFTTGTANSMADVLTALQAACTTGGWTLSGNVLWKGNCYVSVVASATNLIAQGGLGIDGSNALTTPCPTSRVLQAPGFAPVTWPATYFIFVYANEVYLVLRYGLDTYLYLAFGDSALPGAAAGMGVWFGASSPLINPTDVYQYWDRAGGWVDNFGHYVHIGGMFFASFLNANNAIIYSPLDAAGWIGGRAADIGGDLVKVQPNAWNGESTLVPIQPFHVRASNKISVIAELTYARMVRIDNIEPEAIVTLGTDEWMVFPWYKKSTAARDGSGSIAASDGTHTGTFGWAIRKNG
ncbi:hypothetical protein ACFPPA_05580 [Rhodanobacter ginsengisoli]|uniref:Phage tail protein n=1 Tax=Rhodanobacter ginsengisoli TaxID=418646 RepID=A0ABW0QJT3_9GAMM